MSGKFSDELAALRDIREMLDDIRLLNEPELNEQDAQYQSGMAVMGRLADAVDSAIRELIQIEGTVGYRTLDTVKFGDTSTAQVTVADMADGTSRIVSVDLTHRGG